MALNRADCCGHSPLHLLAVDMGQVMPDFDKIKRDKLLDLFRRVIANPENLAKVVDAVALNWCPPFKIDRKGNTAVVLDNGHDN